LLELFENITGVMFLRHRIDAVKWHTVIGNASDSYICDKCTHC